MEHNKPYFYTSYIQHERHALVDEAVEASLDALRIPEVAKELGEYAVILSDILQKVTVPNIRHNRVILGDGCDDRTPIITVHPREVLFRNPCDMGFSAAQRQALIGGFGEEFADVIVASQENYTKSVEDAARIDSLRESGVLAYVHRCAWPLETTIGNINFQTAPIMMLDFHDKNNRKPPVVLHEAVHIHQLNEYPVEMPSDDPYRLLVEAELEAYNKEASIMRGLDAAGRRTDIGSDAGEEALFIDEVRRRYQRNTENPFEANDLILEALEINSLRLT